MNVKKLRKKNPWIWNKRSAMNFEIIWRSLSFRLSQSRVYVWYGNKKFSNFLITYIRVKLHVILKQDTGVNIHKIPHIPLIFILILNFNPNCLKHNINGVAFVKWKKKQDYVVHTSWKFWYWKMNRCYHTFIQDGLSDKKIFFKV